MTREETIHELGEWLEQMIKHGVPSHSAKRKALATAIALLSAEPSGDLISRAELRKAFCKINDLRTLSLGKVGEIIDSVPSADRPTEILDDRTLVVKVQNAKEVGRVWVQDADKNVHIGGGFYYHENSADRPMVDRDYLVNLIQESVYDGEACARLIDMVDRPTDGDLISRADAIEAFERGRVYHKSGIEEIINALPSADRPSGDLIIKGGDAEMREQDFRPRYMRKTPSEDGSDLISRADAVEAVRECFKDVFANKSEWDATKGRLILQDRGIAEYNNAICDRLSALPSAEYSKLLQTTLNIENNTKVNDLVFRPPAEQVTSKLKNPCDSLLTEDSEDAKEQKSKLECDTCKHQDKEWDSVECDSCCGNNSHYEPSGDLISRADAIEAINRICRPICDMPINVIEALHRVPSVSAERVGEWELCKDIDGGYGVCSVCGTDADFSHYGKPYDYCPSCGAKMKGGGE